jgi:hypothetical protein
MTRERGLQRHPRRARRALHHWGIGDTDPDAHRTAQKAGCVAQNVPVNYFASFAPVLQPTLDTGTEALVAAALAWQGRA